MCNRYMFHLRDISLGMLVAWRHIPRDLRDTFLVLKEFLYHVMWLILMFLSPVLVPFSILLAAYAYWSERQRAKRRAQFKAQVIERRPEIDRMVFGKDGENLTTVTRDRNNYNGKD